MLRQQVRDPSQIRNVSKLSNWYPMPGKRQIKTVTHAPSPCLSLSAAPFLSLLLYQCSFFYHSVKICPQTLPVCVVCCVIGNNNLSRLCFVFGFDFCLYTDHSTPTDHSKNCIRLHIAVWVRKISLCTSMANKCNTLDVKHAQNLPRALYVVAFILQILYAEVISAHIHTAFELISISVLNYFTIWTKKKWPSFFHKCWIELCASATNSKLSEIKYSSRVFAQKRIRTQLFEYPGKTIRNLRKKIMKISHNIQLKIWRKTST